MFLFCREIVSDAVRLLVFCSETKASIIGTNRTTDKNKTRHNPRIDMFLFLSFVLVRVLRLLPIPPNSSLGEQSVDLIRLLLLCSNIVSVYGMYILVGKVYTTLDRQYVAIVDGWQNFPKRRYRQEVVLVPINAVSSPCRSLRTPNFS